MQQIKFVLWERYRAWWGAHQLNDKNPLLLDHLKDEEKANELGMTIRQYRQHRATEEKKAKIAIARNEEKNKAKATQREIRRTAARTLAKEKAARKVEERRAELERKAKEEEERKDAAMMDMYQKLAAGGPEIAKLEMSVDPVKVQAEAEEVKSEGDKGGETVEQSGDGQEKPDDTPKQ
jgi:hypothetical protein